MSFLRGKFAKSKPGILGTVALCGSSDDMVSHYIFRAVGFYFCDKTLKIKYNFVVLEKKL
ncbi:MAG: hypothetical protein A3G91_01320 [Omnitrophica WOR_2 bacterium RIFCSPLOWO2_12_FULL_50_9]|nr:MAG: hypothetical protein A3D87_04735 [Omnitrophica WOR_2 bacterium RIFCSPHIGHO2_02_FULL_50_17]OGX43161.1 MAG: hypothetical protein A3G91_01320 [Omnitrophica WOR_2 bacterium RIFCSPLOWO2_12_FULL_50_9]